MNHSIFKQVARVLAAAEGDRWYNPADLVRLLSFALKLREIGLVAGREGVRGRKACRQLVRLLVRLVADPVKVEVEAFEAGHDSFVRMSSLGDLDPLSETAVRRRRMLMRRRVEQANGAYFDAKRLNHHVFRLIELYGLTGVLCSTALHLRSVDQVGGDISSAELQRWLDWAECSFFKMRAPGLGDILEDALRGRSFDQRVERALMELDCKADVAA